MLPARYSSSDRTAFQEGTTMRRKFGLALLTLILLWAPQVRAQGIEDTLKNLPGESLAIVITNRLEQIDERLQAMAKKMGLGLPLSPIELAKVSLGITKGLDMKGSLAVAVMPPS